MKLPVLTIIVPCYNEEEILSKTMDELTAVLLELMELKLVSNSSNILFVDDGSKDHTWNLIQVESMQNHLVRGIKLAGNVGHQNALLAGLEAAQRQSDCVISIDADLQDDISVIRTMVEKYNDGYDIVYGVRDKRQTDTFFKRNTALAFYRVMGTLGIRLIPNHADYRLMSKRALKELLKYKERKERERGISKYPLKKMLSFAFDGITSFSVAPIRFVTYLGFITLLVSILAGGYALLQKWLGNTQSGWTSLMISLWIIGGLQLIGIGVVGEYIGKIFKEVKRRPIYAIDVDHYSENLEDEEASEASWKRKGTS